MKAFPWSAHLRVDLVPAYGSHHRICLFFCRQGQTGMTTSTVRWRHEQTMNAPHSEAVLATRNGARAPRAARLRVARCMPRGQSSGRRGRPLLAQQAVCSLALATGTKCVHSFRRLQGALSLDRTAPAFPNRNVLSATSFGQPGKRRDWLNHGRLVTRFAGS